MGQTVAEYAPIKPFNATAGMSIDTPHLGKGRYRVSLGHLKSDLPAILSLRERAFGVPAGVSDRFDDICDHLLVHDIQNGELVCSTRVLMPGVGGIARSYCAQFYDLSALATYPGRMAELGRFCIDPDRYDPDILRIAWGALAAYVDENKIEMLFGCSSFSGSVADPHLETFAMLKARHLAPEHWRPGIAAAEVIRFDAVETQQPDMRRALRAMPPLLRSYLMMGGRVSDHAVVDRQMNTLHVFTGLEIKAIPAIRKHLLRMVGGVI